MHTIYEKKHANFSFYGFKYNFKSSKSLLQDFLILADSITPKSTKSSLNKSNYFIKNNDLISAKDYAGRYFQTNAIFKYKGINSLGVISKFQIGFEKFCLKTFDSLYVKYKYPGIVSNYTYFRLTQKLIDNKIAINNINSILDLHTNINTFSLAVLKGKEFEFEKSNIDCDFLLSNDSNFNILKKKDVYQILGNNYYFLNDDKNSLLNYEKTHSQFANWGKSCVYFRQDNFKKALSFGENVPNEYINAFLNKGNLYIKNNKYNKAEEIFKKHLQTDSNSIIALNGLGYSFQGLKQFDSSYYYFDKALNFNTNYAPALVGKGNTLFFEKYDLTGAFGYYLKAKPLIDGNKYLDANLALTEFQLSKYSSADTYLNQIIQKQNRFFNEDLYLLMALNKFNLNAKKDAEKYLDSFLIFKPNHPFGLMIKGYILYEKGDKAMALSFLNQSAKSNDLAIKLPSNHLIGIISLETNQYANAENAFSNIITENKIDFKAFSGLAMAQSQLKKFEEAHKNINIAISIANEGLNFENLKCNQSVIYFQEGDWYKSKKETHLSHQKYHEAIKCVEKFGTRFTNNIGVYYNALGKHEHAKKSFNLAAGTASSFNNLGVVESLISNFSKASKLYDKAVDIDNDYYVYSSNRYLNGTYTGNKNPEDYIKASNDIEAKLLAIDLESKFRFVYNCFYFPEFSPSYKFEPYSLIELNPVPYPDLIYPFYVFSDSIVRRSHVGPAVGYRPGKYKGLCPIHLSRTRSDEQFDESCNIVDSLVRETIAENVNDNKIELLANKVIDLLQSKKSENCYSGFYDYTVSAMKENFQLKNCQLKFLPILKEFQEKGLIKPITYAKYIDEYQIYIKSKQVYGTYIEYNKQKKEYFSPNIVSVDSVNLKRKELGLGLIEIEYERLKKGNK